MKILSLDLAKHRIGWAVDGAAVLPPASGVYETNAKDLKNSRVLFDFSRWLYDLVGADGIEMLVYEDPLRSFGAVNNGDWNIWKGRLVGVVEIVSHARQIALDHAPVQQWRKHFLSAQPKKGDGKAATMARLDLMGWTYADDNAADAIGLWVWAKHKHDPKTFPAQIGTALFARVPA